jgi:hypothetical protein
MNLCGKWAYQSSWVPGLKRVTYVWSCDLVSCTWDGGDDGAVWVVVTAAASSLLFLMKVMV